MEEIRNAALAYHARLSHGEKQFAENLFKSLDANRDGKIAFRVYKAAFADVEKKVKGITDPRFFKKLAGDKDGFLDKRDVITLSYLINTGKVLFCDSCGEFVMLQFFACIQCFNRSANGEFYKLCSSCYGGGIFEHHSDAKFLDKRFATEEPEAEARVFREFPTA